MAEDPLESPDGSRIAVRRLNALKDGSQLVFVLVAGSELLAAAQVGPPTIDSDPEPPDLSVPARLQMVAVAVPGHCYGARLVRALQSRAFANLVHDGCLSAAGKVLVTRVDLPIQDGKVIEPLSDERASKLAAELIEFVHENPSGVEVK